MLFRLAAVTALSVALVHSQGGAPVSLPAGTTIQINGQTYQIGPRSYTFDVVGPPPELIEGTVRRLNLRSIVIESPDHRISWYRFARKLRVDEDRLHLGDRVAIVYQPDINDIYTALLVEPIRPGTAEERAAAYRDWDLPSLEDVEGKVEEPTMSRLDPDDVRQLGRHMDPPPGIPRLPPAPLLSTQDPILLKAAEASAAYLRDLPNFSVRREVSRYSQAFSGKLSLIDVVTANLIYTEGSEFYSNIRVNNKQETERLKDLSGTHTTGEFGDIAFALFDDVTHARFTAAGEQLINGRGAWKYTYAVDRENSRWRIFSRSEHYYPAYGGQIWIDKENYRVLRLEQEALNFPYRFRYYQAELNIDYTDVRLDEGVKELMPTRAEALSCLRLAPNCQRNSTLFLNYAKFGAASTVAFDEVQ